MSSASVPAIRITLQPQAVRALNDTEVFFAMDKGEAKSDLLALRREVCRRFISGSDYRFVELPDPPRATDGDYGQAVSEWHTARARLWADAIGSELGPDGVGSFLAWGDPSLYDSTLRILDQVAEHVDLSYDVIPGIHRHPGADHPASHTAQRRR